MYREEREEERYMIQSITFQDQVSVSFNQLNQRQSLGEFRTECIKAHFLINCIALLKGCFDGGGGGGAGCWKARGKGGKGWQVSSLLLKEMPLAVYQSRA